MNWATFVETFIAWCRGLLALLGGVIILSMFLEDSAKRRTGVGLAGIIIMIALMAAAIAALRLRLVMG